MDLIEQQLWDYIDGNLDQIQAKFIEEKINAEPQFKIQYEELLQFSQKLEDLTLEEPSMSFTRNVMEDVASVPAPISLKTKIDTRVIYGVGGFLVLPILAILAFTAYNSTFTMPRFDFDLSFEVNKMITPTALYAFLFVDLVIGLIFMDYFFRNKSISG